MTAKHLALIQKTAQKNGGKLSVLIRTKGKTKLSYNLNQCYEAASVAKLGIVVYVLAMINNGAMSEDHELTLLKKHKRGGTGILRYFRSGFKLSIGEALRLMLIESDNTATNVLLESVGPQARINDWLKEELGVATTGLTEREDRLFESDLMLPSDMMTVLESLEDQKLVWDSLSRSHFTEGLRSFSDQSSGSDAVTLCEAKIWGLVATRNYQRNILKRVLDSEPSQIAALKDGLLPDFEGHSYRHEVGKFYGPDEPLVVVCTRDTPVTCLTEIGQTIYDWCQKGG